MENKLKVLMTGAGAPGGPGIIKAILKDKFIDLYICDCNNGASGKYLIPHKFQLISKANDINFIENILDICLKLNIKVIFPLVTKELFKLASNKSTFEREGIKIIVSDINSLKIANNKGFLYEHLKSKNIKIPQFHITNEVEDMKKKIYNLGYPNIPVVIKPCEGNGSRGIRIIDNSKNRLDILLNEKPTSLYTTMEEIMNTLSTANLPDFIVSEYLPGDELTIDTVIQNSKIVDLLIRTRDQMRSGISIAGRFIEDANVFNYIKEIVSTLPGLEGPVGFQLKKSSNNEYLLLECNPRIQGSSVSAMGLGINLPIRSIKLSRGIELEKVKKKSGLSFARFYEEVFYES